MPTTSATIRATLADALWFFGGNFAIGLLFSLPVKLAVAEPYDCGFLLCLSFATLFVLAGAIFQQRGFWSEIVIGTAVFGCVALKLIGAHPIFTAIFPFFFLVSAAIVGGLLMVAGKLERPELWDTTGREMVSLKKRFT